MIERKKFTNQKMCAAVIVTGVIMCMLPPPAHGIAGYKILTQQQVLSANGQDIDDDKGNVFMEEVVDDKQAAREAEQEERQQHVKIDRHPLTPEEASRLGIQITPSGQVIPLINKGGPPVKEYGTTFTQTYQPAWTLVPTVPLGAPIYGNPLAAPILPANPALGSAPILRRNSVLNNILNPLLTPLNPLGPYYNGISPYQNPLSPYYGGTSPYYGGLSPYFSGISPYYGGISPYFSGYPGAVLYAPPAVSFSYSTSGQPGADGTIAAPPQSVSTSSTILNRPFWSGYTGVTPMGTRFGGVNLGLPSVTQYQSTTTFTPIAPHFSNQSGNPQASPFHIQDDDN